MAESHSSGRKSFEMVSDLRTSGLSLLNGIGAGIQYSAVVKKGCSEDHFGRMAKTGMIPEALLVLLNCARSSCQGPWLEVRQMGSSAHDFRVSASPCKHIANS